MIRVLLADDEPLVLIGMQSMIDWAALGYDLVGTARNGADALERIAELSPEVVITDIRMPVLDGLQLAERCRAQGSGLPVFIMLTSYEEFEYVRRSISAGVVDYLVKVELTPESLTAALDRAREAVAKEQALRAPSAPGGMEMFRSRFFLQLYGGQFQTEDEIRTRAAELGLHPDAPAYAVVIAALQNRALDTDQQATLCAGVTRMAADVLPKYLPCHVTGTDLRHFTVLFSLDGMQNTEEVIRPVLDKANEILYKYFSVGLRWAVGAPVDSLVSIPKSQREAFAVLPLLSEAQPIMFSCTESRTGLDRRARVVADVQEYIRRNLDKRLSLNDVAAVFSFSPGYLSQLFAQNGDSGFVQFVTDTRIAAAKELMAGSDLKIYEISERVGFESAFYFSKVFKKQEGCSPRDYIQRIKGVDAHADGTV